ncbi:PfkB family carbohydrate kinase [Demequina sp. B12]|uniref:PfkB family carbohydrate kinase n=1 Tax=Demequina sp. B12 TaxID=2992757 RepID=UPI00237B1335|nr:PfkB family carbohydrate kinase [Demequina sp. B12]MDE0572763.1 PfkB family carbohydrate kinase [Demequina sp. B12]
MDSPRLGVLCAGLTTLDVVHLVDAVPPANLKVASRDFFMAAGGPAANAAVASAHCGSPTTLVTALPPHPLTDVIVSDLTDCGVDVDIADHTLSGPPLTAAIMITASTGERAVVSPTSAATDVPATPPQWDAASLVQDAGAVLIDGYHRHLSVPLACAAQERGVPVVLDAGSYKHYTPELVKVTDIAVVSDDFRFPDSPGDPHDTLERLMAAGVSAAVVTRGHRPMLLQHGDDLPVEIPVTPVPVVDTLGAGDFLHGALAHRIATLGFAPERLADDLAYASQVVGRSLGSFGTRAWLG